VLRSQTAKVTNRAAQAFRMAAYAVSRSDTAVGAYYRAMRARKGPQQANVATAHKLARIVYHLLKYGEAMSSKVQQRMRNSDANARCASWPDAQASWAWPSRPSPSSRPCLLPDLQRAQVSQDAGALRHLSSSLLEQAMQCRLVRDRSGQG
jgi:hypothetical protein